MKLIFEGQFGAILTISGPSRRHGWIPRVRASPENGPDSFGNLPGTPIFGRVAQKCEVFLHMLLNLDSFSFSTQGLRRGPSRISKGVGVLRGARHDTSKGAFLT